MAGQDRGAHRRDRPAGPGHLRRRLTSAAAGRRRSRGPPARGVPAAERAYSTDHDDDRTGLAATAHRCHVGRPGDPRVRPQRGRLRGAGRAARGRRVPPGRRPGRRRHGGGQHLRLRRGGQEGLRRHAARRPPTSRTTGPHAGRRGGRLPGRAVRQGPRRVAARGRRGARLRRLPRHRRPAALDPGGRDRTSRTRPQDRRRLLPITPVERDASTRLGPGPRPRRARRRRTRDRPARRTPPARRRPDGAAQAGQRLRPPLLVLRDPELPRLVREPPPHRRARRGPLAGRRRASRELFLVSENSTSYGKDLGDLRLLETLLPELAAVDGVDRVRVSYLQPAETRPGLVEAIADARPASRRTSTCPSSTPAPPCCAGCAASATPRASSACSSGSARLAPTAGVRSNVIVGFPGETEDDLADAVRLPGRGAAWTSPASSATPTRTAPRPRRYDGKLDDDEVRARVEHVTALVEELTAQRAEERIGETRRGAGRVASSDGVRRGPGRPPGPRGRRHHHARAGARGRAVGDLRRRPSVVGTDGRRPGGRDRSETER